MAQAVSIRDSSILKPKKLALAQQDWSLPAVEWSPDRKKPVNNFLSSIVLLILILY